MPAVNNAVRSATCLEVAMRRRMLDALGPVRP
jgi:hypothetical protein